MKNHELLNLIGDVNEDYVLEAGNNVVKPRFRWKTLAACAACGLLVLGAYPVYQAANPPLHGYTVLEGGGMATLDDVKAPAGSQIDIPGQNPPAPNPVEPPRGDGPDAIPGGAYIGGGKGETGIDGTEYCFPAQDVPADEAAAAQYDRLLKGLGGVNGMEPASYPDWFAGAWIDHGGDPDTPARLTVAIVDGFRTPELEAQVRGWCGGTGEVAIVDAKYSKNHLNGLMEPVTRALDGTGLSCGIGVDVIANCLGVDLYGEAPAPEFEKALAELAKLDPAGDAIRVRLFTGKLDTLTDELNKGPASEPIAPDARATPATTVDGGEPVYHGADAPADAVPGGVTQPQDGAQKCGELEEGKPAHYDLLPLDE